MCSKNIETEAVFTTRKMNNEQKVNFLQNGPFDIQHTNNPIGTLTVSSVEGQNFIQKECGAVYDTKLHLMVKLLFWRSRKCVEHLVV